MHLAKSHLDSLFDGGFISRDAYFAAFNEYIKGEKMTELESTRAKLKCMEMVEGTGLNWWNVVRLAGNECKTPLDFSYPTACYTFALGVVEGKPVWEGDTLYHPEYGKVTVSLRGGTSRYAIKICKSSGVEFGCMEFLSPSFSWSPPKPATLMVELPIEDVEYYANEKPICLSKIESMIETRAIHCRIALRKALEQLK